MGTFVASNCLSMGATPWHERYRIGCPSEVGASSGPGRAAAPVRGLRYTAPMRDRESPARSFEWRYTAAGGRLLAEGGTRPSGTAVRNGDVRVMQREFEEYGRRSSERLAGLPNSQLYRLRREQDVPQPPHADPGYATDAGARSAIGASRAPSPPPHPAALRRRRQHLHPERAVAVPELPPPLPLPGRDRRPTGA